MEKYIIQLNSLVNYDSYFEVTKNEKQKHLTGVTVIITQQPLGHNSKFVMLRTFQDEVEYIFLEKT